MKQVEKKEAWYQWMKICKGDLKFAAMQWNLFWSGERGIQLHDNCIYLISVFGYDAKK